MEVMGFQACKNINFFDTNISHTFTDTYLE